MITLRRTTSEDPDFVNLVRLLDADLARRDGDDHAFYAQFNKIDTIRHVVIAYTGEVAIGCGALKAYDETTAEIKRMFVTESFRNKGIASLVLGELENWASALGFEHCILETGIKQPEAMALYKKCGYAIIPNYGQYTDVTDSKCFKKQIPVIV